MKEKAIYGLAATYTYPFVEYQKVLNQYKVIRKTQDSFMIDPLLVVMTMDHDYSKEIGWTGLDWWSDRINPNLTLVLNKRGLFFKLIPNSELGFESYENVRNGLTTQCSITYHPDKKSRDFKWEKNLEFLSSESGENANFLVYDYSENIISEICICEQGKNQETFCTTNKNDPRLKGIKWESDSK